MKTLIALALLISQGVMSIKAMVPADNQENGAQVEQVTQEDVRPALRPRLSDLYEIDYDLGPKEIFFNEHVFFFTTIENIAQNPDNLTSPETLKQSINQILSLSSITKSYRSYLNELLANYTNGEQDQAPRGIKVMRYILAHGNPQAKNEVLSFNSLRQACDLLELLNNINALTDEQIREGNLLDNNSPLGKLYDQILEGTSRMATTKFFDKVKAAFADNQEELQQVFIQQDSYGVTPLHYAAFNNNPEVIRAITNALQQAFTGNPKGLQQALTQPHQNFLGSTLLQNAAGNNNPEVVRVIINALQQAFTGNPKGLQQALTQQNRSGDRPLHYAAENKNHEVVRAIINALQQAFTDNQEGLLQALTQQDRSGNRPLHYAAENKNHEVVRAIINALQQAFADNQEGLLQALTQQNNRGNTPLQNAAYKNNHEIITILQRAINEARAAIAAQ